MKRFLVSILTCMAAAAMLFAACTSTQIDTGTQGDDGTSGTDLVEVPSQSYISGAMFESEATSYVKWQGRYEYISEGAYGSPESTVMLYNTATGFTVDFYGTYLKVGFFHRSTESGGSDIYYNFAVDDEVLPNSSDDRIILLADAKISEEITIISGLEEGKHSVTCLKMDEPADAITGIYSFSTDGGFYERDVEQDNSSLKFMFVCASGGSGYGSLVCTQGTNSITRTRANSSSLHSFNYLTARMYGADVQYVAQAGWGLCFPKKKSIASVFDYTGILGCSYDDTLYNNVAGAKTTALWDHTSWVPDVIIFNIGGNDTKASAFDSSTYMQGVIDIVTKLHELYPEAKMLWTHTNSNAGSYAISALNSAGIMSQGYIKQAVIPQVGDDGTYGASSHNSLQTHITTAQTLSNYLEAWGFSPIRSNLTLDDCKDIIITE